MDSLLSRALHGNSDAQLMPRPDDVQPPYGPAPLSFSDQRIADEDAATTRRLDQHDATMRELLALIAWFAERARCAYEAARPTASARHTKAAARCSRILSRFFEREVERARVEWMLLDDESRRHAIEHAPLLSRVMRAQ